MKKKILKYFDDEGNYYTNTQFLPQIKEQIIKNVKYSSCIFSL